MKIPRKCLEQIPDVDRYERLLAEMNEPIFLDVFAGRLLICDGTSGPIPGSLGLSFEECKKAFLDLDDKITSLGLPYLDWDGRRNYGGQFIKRNYLKKLDPKFKYWAHNGDVVSFVEGECVIETVPKGYVDPNLGAIRVLRVKIK